MKIYALLNGESFKPALMSFSSHQAKILDERSLMLVKAVLLPRKPIEKIGLAPMTSMFVHGENMPVARAKVTAEVHDSDGLLVHHASDEWLWRPLFNPKFFGSIASWIKIQKVLDFFSAIAILTTIRIHITNTTSGPAFGLSHKESGVRER